MRTLKVILITLAALLFGGASAQKPVLPLPIDSLWVKDYPPFRIAGNLYYVGSYDLASYLITTPKGDILINTGVAGSDTMIRRHVEALGFRFSDIKILLINQAHFDHAGGLAAVKRETGATLMADRGDASVLADGGSSDVIFGGKGPVFAPVKADRLLHDRDTIRLGGMRVVLLHHPGHTKGSCSYLFDVKDETRTYRVLIANMPSVLSATNLSGMPAYPTVGKDYAYTFAAMKKLHFDIWFAAHAGQFDLQAKHPAGSAYRPQAFVDQQGYDSELEELYQAYVKKRDADAAR
jgi:metallo-beta-lactamase class B